MEEDRSTDYVLQHTAAVIGKRSDQTLQEQLGIGLAQYRVLLMLERFPRATQRQIADHLGQTEAGISRQTKLLESKGLLAVQVGERHKREHALALTPKGIRLVQAARDILGQYLGSIYGAFTAKEEKRLAHLLNKLHVQLCVDGKLLACDRPFDPWLASAK